MKAQKKINGLRFFLVIFALVFGINTSIAQEKPASLQGYVIDLDTHDSLAYAKIDLKDKDGKIQNATSDKNGFYSFTGLIPGKYSLNVSLKGYEKSQTASLQITAGQVLKHDIHLSPVMILKEEESLVMDYHSSPKISNTGYERNKNLVGYAGSYSSDVPHNTESYSAINENGYKNVKTNPLSTFSVDVDAASYSNVRRYLTAGNKPPVDAVRVEEFINYFDYDYPDPVDEHPFSITTEIGNCPWNDSSRLVHIGLQAERLKTKDLPANNLVFLLDVSGSMNAENKLPLLKKSFQMLVEELRPEDHVAIVVYAGAAGIVLPSTSVSKANKLTILESLEALSAGGSTAGGQGIQLAYKVAEENFIKDGNNRVILATDGDFNIGMSSDGEMQRLIEEKRKTGIFLTCLGFGMGNYKDSKLEILADKGNGNYAYIDNLLEAKKVLVTEIGGTLVTLAKDVKIQVEFNPMVVESYRLIGYENRLLNEEDFNDDKKDAGEIGAGHSVTALYEVVLKGEGSAPSVDPLRYQESQQTKSALSNEMLTVKFRYKKPNEDTSILLEKNLANQITDWKNNSADFKFSAAVAGFGMILRDSEFKGKTTYDLILSWAQEGKGDDKNGYRAEFIRLVELSKSIR